MTVQRTEVEREIGELIKFIKKLGTLNDRNQYVVTFGVLFDDDEVPSTFSAIVGTLKAAKRRKIVKFRGRYLLKGTHDNVKITLIKNIDQSTKGTSDDQNIRNDLMKLPMHKLKKKCKAMKISSEGYKSDMINRIISVLKQNPQKHHHIVNSSLAISRHQWNYLQDELVKRLGECMKNKFVFDEESILRSQYIFVYLKEQNGIELSDNYIENEGLLKYVCIEHFGKECHNQWGYFLSVSDHKE